MFLFLIVQILKGKLVLPPYLSPEANDFIRKVSIYTSTGVGGCAFLGISNFAC